MLLTITFLPSKDNFVEAQWFNLCWTFSNKKLSTYVKPRDNPYGIPNNFKMALDEGHVHLNSFVQVDLLSFIPPIQKAIDLAWLILRPNVMLKKSSSCVNQIMPSQDASKVKLVSSTYWAIICLLFDTGKRMLSILPSLCSSQILALRFSPIIKNRQEASGHPCCTPFLITKALEVFPFTTMFELAPWKNTFIILTNSIGILNLSIGSNKKL